MVLLLLINCLCYPHCVCVCVCVCMCVCVCVCSCVCVCVLVCFTLCPFSCSDHLKEGDFVLLSHPCLAILYVLWLFLMVPWVGLQFVIVVFSDHTRLL